MMHDSARATLRTGDKRRDLYHRYRTDTITAVAALLVSMGL
jgi:hypothetical protein